MRPALVFDKNCLFQWSPDKSSVFGSSAEDGILNIWDHERVRDPYLLISFLLTFPYGPYTEEVLLVNGENLVVCNSFNRHFHDLHKVIYSYYPIILKTRVFMNKTEEALN